MTIEEYLVWRKNFLALPLGKKLETPRGECIVGDSLFIEDDVRPNWHLKNRELEDAEFRLIMYSEDMSPEMHEKLYANDDKLYAAYKSLNLISLITNGKRRQSRKNIIQNSECCLTYWQLHDDTLTVISRSWDIQRAGLSDLVIANRVACVLNCARIRFVSLCSHVYTDRENIARRQDG